MSLWIVFGGFWLAVGWVIAGVIMAITIIGIPWARAAFNIALYTLLPFGQTAVRAPNFSGRRTSAPARSASSAISSGWSSPAGGWRSAI